MLPPYGTVNIAFIWYATLKFSGLGTIHTNSASVAAIPNCRDSLVREPRRPGGGGLRRLGGVGVWLEDFSFQQQSLDCHAWTVVSPVREPYVEDNALQSLAVMGVGGLGPLLLV